MTSPSCVSRVCNVLRTTVVASLGRAALGQAARGRPPLPPRFSGSNSSSKHSLADINTHRRTTSKHSIKAAELTPTDNVSPYSSLGQPSLARGGHHVPSPYHIDLATMTLPSSKPSKSRFQMPSGLYNMLPRRRGSKESRGSSRGSIFKRRSSSPSSARPFSVVSTGTLTQEPPRRPEDDYALPPPPEPLMSPEALPPPPPPPAPDPLDPNIMALRATASPRGPVAPARSVHSSPVPGPYSPVPGPSRPPYSPGQVHHSPATAPRLQSPMTSDKNWGMEFEGRMRTLSQNKMGIKQKESKR